MLFSIVIPALVQSVTEFLPISSSGHLILLEKFKISPQTLVMDVALHVGTLLAVMTYFWRDVVNMVSGLFKKGANRQLLIRVIVATVPVVLVGGLLKSVIEDTFRSVILIAVTSICYGVLLWWVDVRSPRRYEFNEISLKSAFLIGCAQVLSLVPGTSRSGVTMTCARFLGISRDASARFSMLLSMPTIFLGAVYVFYTAWGQSQLTHVVLDRLIGGIALSALFGFLVIWGLMWWLKRASFAVFGIYRILLGFFLICYFL